MKGGVGRGHLVVLAWTLLLSLLIWQKASISDQLPITDAFEYYAKAKHFWDAIHSAKPAVAFDAEPAFRPFGTVLMSYPFGFDEDPRPFYFRSVLYGIVALMIAVFVATTDRAKRAEAASWPVIVALSASVLPMFYHFEASALDHDAPAFWGLVDGFFAGLAAIAAAAVVRAVGHRSIAWTFVAVCASAYSILVKPTGALVMVITGAAWFTGIASAWLGERDRAARKRTLAVLATGSIGIAVVFGGVLWWCINSRYLSGASVAFGSYAMTTLQADWQNTRSWEAVSGYLYPSFGVFFPLALILPPLFLLLGNRLPAMFWRTYGWHLLVAVMTLLAGLWLWLVTSNGTQVRYLFPFALAAMIFSLPPLQYAFSTVASSVRTVSVALFAIPVVATIVLLVFPDVPRVWQQRLGVSLHAGPAPPEGVAARRLLEDLRTNGKSGVTVYDLTMGRVAARVLASHAQFEQLVHPDKGSFDIVTATDWIPPSVVKTRELIDADYILVAPLPEPDRTAWEAADDSDFQREAMIFAAWGTNLGVADGIVTLAAGDAFRLYKVQDRDKLERSVAALREGRKWRAAFLEHNPPYWWSREQMEAALQPGSVAVRDVAFDSIYNIEAVRARRADGVIVVDVWWTRRPGGNPSAPDRMFLHLQDNQNQVVRIVASWLHPRASMDPSTPIRLSSFRFPATPNETMSVAFGIYDDTKKFLLADRGNRDWHGQRVVIPVPP